MKGEEPTADERTKAHLLAVGTRQPVVLFGGNVWHTTPGTLFDGNSDSQMEMPCGWAACTTCHAVRLVSLDAADAAVGCFPCACCQAGVVRPTVGTANAGSCGIQAAFQAARQARFKSQ